jgi:signal transduction histidine kinase
MSDRLAMPLNHRQIWRYLRPLAAPLVVLALALTLWEPISWWLQGEERYDRHALKEWVLEAKTSTTLPELVSKLLDANEQFLHGQGDQKQKAEQQLVPLRQQILVHLRALGEPVTKMYAGQLPLFPVIYRLEVHFAPALHLEPISWDSELPRQIKQSHRLVYDVPLDERGASVAVEYHLRVYAWQQVQEREEAARRLRLGGLALAVGVLLLVWVYLGQRRQRQRQRQELLARQQVSEAERLRLQEELRRQEAERRREEAERVSLELKSQLFANISIMAGSYAHNIKNLLVRPNDLLSRCLEHDGLSADQDKMLREVRQTLGTVTERLQQILQTVRRDPTRSEHVLLDLNELVRDMHRTWDDLGRDKWKLTLKLDLATEPLLIVGDRSHLQQALENLLFNARDATFEMRSHLREQARRQPVEPEDGAGESARRQALIAAAAWKGLITLRTRREGDRAVLEVQDNGIGMSEEVRQKCLQAHFSTKRDNALFAGQGAGMGLGLTFVSVILEHHQANLSIESAPLCGALFRAAFPLADLAANRSPG